MFVETLVEDLQRQRTHADVIAVWESQRHRQSPAPIFEDGAGFVVN